MKVIIKKTGTVQNVSEGYARNYLLPKGLAEIATKEALDALEQHNAVTAEEQAKQKKQWEQDAQTLKNASLTLSMKANDDGTLFGKLTTSAILEAVQSQAEIRLQEDWITLPKDVKHVGEQTIRVTFPSNLQINFSLTIKAE